MPPRPADPPAPSPRTSDADRVYRGALTGADAYRTTRAAVRVERGVLRIGNRFVPSDRFREVAFLSVGRAAVSQAFALVDALGDTLTQGFLAGPDAVPEAIPFQHERIPRPVLGDPSAERVAAAALELAGELGPSDLLIVGLSPGALALLATPPPGLGESRFRELLGSLRSLGLSAAEVESFVRVAAGGAVGGALGAAGGATVLPLVVDRGTGAERAGGGPTRPVDRGETEAVHAALRRVGAWDRMPAEVRRSVERPAASTRATVLRPVVVASPADALQGAGDALSEVKWWSRLAGLSLAGDPPVAAAAFHARLDEVLAQVPRSREARRGVAVFAGAPLECPDGEGEGVAIAALLPELRRKARHRELRFLAFGTGGQRPDEPGMSGGLVEASADGIVPIAAARTTRPGITDVGPVLAALRPERPEP